jgi:hypothetical protein
MFDINNHRNMIRKIAHQKHKQCPAVEWEDLEGRGIVLFYEALGRYDAARGKFSSFLYLVLQHEMLAEELPRSYDRDFVPTQPKGWRWVMSKTEGIDEEVGAVEGGVDPVAILEFYDVLHHLSPEAREIAAMVIAAPEDVMDGARGCRKHMVGNLRRLLKAAGWSDWKMWRGFTEIRQALA